MGLGHQLACASLVALFSIALIVTAELFVGDRASRAVMLSTSHQATAPF